MSKRKIDNNDSDDKIVDTLVKKQKLAEEEWPDEMTPEAARRIEKLQEQWREDSLKAQREQAEEVRKRFSVHPWEDHKPKNIMYLPPPRDNRPLTVEKAKELDKLQDQLQREFAHSRTVQVEEKRAIERQQEPIVSELQKLREELNRKNDEIKEMRRQPVLFRPRAMSTPSRKIFEKSTVVPANLTEQDVFDQKQDIPDQKATTPEQKDIFEVETIMEAAKSSLPDEDLHFDKSIQAVVDNSGTELGTIAKQYMSRANDATFGLRYDPGERKLKVGNSTVTVHNDDIIIDKTNERFTGTPGLWRFLTQSRDIGSEQYSNDDRDVYKTILVNTGAIYQNNDPSSGRPKSSSGLKWRKIIKPMWEELRSVVAQGNALGSGLKKTSKCERVMGSSLLVDSNSPIEYKYIRQYTDLIRRLYFLQAEESAGNNSFHNEKLAIAKFIYDTLMELTDQPNGPKYIIRCMLVLPKPSIKYIIDLLKTEDEFGTKHLKYIIEFIRDNLERQIDLPDGPMYLARCLSALPEKIIEGSGILNDIINKLPFEFHAPGMNFLGPGTKLKERLDRGDKGVNPLDEAAKEHDIWYSKHKRAEDRWEADKVLQDKAFDRVLAPDASLYERPLALATGTAMWAKRALGMGLQSQDEGVVEHVPDDGKRYKKIASGLTSYRKKQMRLFGRRYMVQNGRGFIYSNRSPPDQL